MNWILHQYPLCLFWCKQPTFLAQIVEQNWEKAVNGDIISRFTNVMVFPSSEAGPHLLQHPADSFLPYGWFSPEERRKIKKIDPYAAGYSGCVWTGSLIHVRK